MAQQTTKRKASSEADATGSDENESHPESLDSQESGRSSMSRPDSETDSSSEEEDLPQGDIVDVEFLFFYPKENDFHGLKSLLRTYLDGEEFCGCSELVQTIIQQVCYPMN
jgi:protein BCP1